MTDVSEQDAIRFSEYLDGEMSDAERDAFEAELAADAELAEAFDAFSKTLDLLGGLAVPKVDLARGVERKIRRRSRGRYFGSSSLYRQRVQTEIFIAVALVLLAGIALLATPGGLKALLGSQEFETIADPEPVPDGADGLTEPNEEEPEGREQATPDVAEDGLEPGANGARATPAGEGATSGAPIREMERHEFLYSVATVMTLEALERRIDDQFGAFERRTEGGQVYLAVPRAEIGTVVASLGDIGTVERTRAAVAGTPATLDIVFSAGQ